MFTRAINYSHMQPIDLYTCTIYIYIPRVMLCPNFCFFLLGLSISLGSTSFAIMYVLLKIKP